jgi:uncharacterized repeat protein (TIGR01451 family)
MSVKNESTQSYTIHKAAFHSPQAGCGGYDDTLDNTGWDKISGQETYAPGQSGNLVYRYDVQSHNCGRVQYDAGFDVTDAWGTDHHVFIGEVVNYGVDCGTVPPERYKVEGYVFIDSNRNGIFDSGEETLSGRTIYLNNPQDTVVYSTTNTNGSGFYQFSNLPAGDGRVKHVVPSGYQRTTDDSIPFSLPPNRRFDFGIIREEVIPAPTINLSSSPSSICRGESASLYWNSSNATRVSVNNGIGDVALSGNRNVSPTNTTTYTATAYNSAGNQASSSTTITVRDCSENLIISISVSPSSICRGESANINWSTSGATSVSINPNIGSVGLSGSRSVSPNNTTTYTINASNSSTSRSESATLNVNDCGGSNSINIAKTVRNITNGSSYDSENVNANPGDTVEFTIRVSGSGNWYNSWYNGINNLRVSDELPGGLRYVNGSTTVDGNYANDNLVHGGINLGNKNSNFSTTIRFRASVENDSYFSSGTNTVINTARAYADNTPNASDTASVYIFRGSNSVGRLDIQKYEKNITRGETTERTLTTGSYNDTIEYTLRIRNVSSGSINNVIVYDPIPSTLTYVPGSSALNGYAVGDGITSNGLNIGTLSANQEATVRLFAKINTSYAQSIINTGQVRGDNVSTVNSQPVQINMSSGIVLGALTVRTGAGSVTVYSFIGALLVVSGYYLIEKKRPGLLPQIFVKKA